MAAAVRRATARAIEALHRQIAALIAAEVSHYDRKNPKAHRLIRAIAHEQIKWLANAPHVRELAERERER